MFDSGKILDVPNGAELVQGRLELSTMSSSRLLSAQRFSQQTRRRPDAAGSC